MAYPTGINFITSNPQLGLQPISTSSTIQNHPLGTTVRAVDNAYGEAQFIYQKGVASTAAGDLCTYNTKAGTSVRAVHGGATSLGPCGVAMSANLAAQYGWYAIEGSVPVKTGTVLANTRPYMTSTAGQLDDAVVATDAIDGALFASTDSGGFATIQLTRPCLNGNG